MTVNRQQEIIALNINGSEYQDNSNIHDLKNHERKLLRRLEFVYDVSNMKEVSSVPDPFPVVVSSAE